MRAIFLDRDGVLNEDSGYVFKTEALRIFPGVPEALAKLKLRGFLLIIISNQSGVARGYFDLAAVESFNEALLTGIEHASGVRIDDVFVCPHHPQGVIATFTKVCTCRKPEVGMILSAQRKHGIDLSSSYLVGDKPSDIDCALRAGVRGIQVLRPGEKPHPGADACVASLEEALAYIKD